MLRAYRVLRFIALDVSGFISGSRRVASCTWHLGLKTPHSSRGDLSAIQARCEFFTHINPIDGTNIAIDRFVLVPIDSAGQRGLLYIPRLYRAAGARMPRYICDIVVHPVRLLLTRVGKLVVCKRERLALAF